MQRERGREETWLLRSKDPVKERAVKEPGRPAIAVRKHYSSRLKEQTKRRTRSKQWGKYILRPCKWKANTLTSDECEWEHSRPRVGALSASAASASPACQKSLLLRLGATPINESSLANDSIEGFRRQLVRNRRYQMKCRAVCKGPLKSKVACPAHADSCKLINTSFNWHSLWSRSLC